MVLFLVGFFGFSGLLYFLIHFGFILTQSPQLALIVGGIVVACVIAVSLASEFESDDDYCSSAKLSNRHTERCEAYWNKMYAAVAAQSNISAAKERKSKETAEVLRSPHVLFDPQSDNVAAGNLVDLSRRLFSGIYPAEAIGYIGPFSDSNWYMYIRLTSKADIQLACDRLRAIGKICYDR